MRPQPTRLPTPSRAASRGPAKPPTGAPRAAARRGRVADPLRRAVESLGAFGDFGGVQPLEPRVMLSVTKDANGFTVVTPAASSNATIVYVSSTYGNDLLNSGTSPNAPVQTIAKARSLLHNASADQMLLRRGDVFTTPLSGWALSGKSADEPMVIGAYTDPSHPSIDRPKINSGISCGFATIATASNFTPVNHLVLQGVSFEADSRNYRQPVAGKFTTAYLDDSVGGTYGVSVLGPMDDFLVEDCSFQYYRANVVFQANHGAISNIKVRRSEILDSYAPNVDNTGATTTLTSEGLYAEGVAGLTLDGNVLDHNGWTDNNALGAVASIYNHDAYINVGCSNVVVTGNVFANAGSHGLQARAGGIVTNNLFLRDPVAMSYGYVNGAAKAGGVYGEIGGNVVIDDNSINGALRGWGLEIGNIKPASQGGGVNVHDNIYSVDSENGWAAIQVTVGSPGVDSAGNPVASKEVGANDITIQNNIVSGWAKGISINPTLQPGTTGYRGLNNLVVRANDFQQTLQTPVVDHASTFGSASETWAYNRYNSKKADNSSTPWFKVGSAYMNLAAWQASYEPTATSALINYPDPARTVASYNALLGGTSSLDSFLAEERRQSALAWRPQYAGGTVAAYVKTGFAGRKLDLAAPSAGAAATTDVTVAGTPAATFTVSFVDDVQLNAASIGSGDVTVTGPNGYSRAASLVSVTSNADGSVRTATFAAPAANGTGWTAADDGAYALTLNTGAVTDTSGKAVPGGPLGTFNVSIVAAAPSAALAPVADVTAAGQAATLTVTYAGSTSTPTPTTLPLPDAGFETAVVGAGAYAYNAVGAGWTFAPDPAVAGGADGTAPAGAGVSGNASDFTGGNAAAPEGQQVALVQGTGSFAQTVANWQDGSYTIAFRAAQRGNVASAEDFQVLVDGLPVGAFQPADTTYGAYTSAPFTVAAGTHTITFLGLDTVGGDQTAFIDDVHVVRDGGGPVTAAVSAATVDGNDLVVTGPNGFTAPVTVVSVDAPGDGTPRTVVYAVAPAGGWTTANSGTYTVSSRPGQVADANGATVPAGVLGSFRVNVAPIVPPAATAFAPNITGATSAPQTISVTYTDDTGINPATINAGNLLVVGPNGYSAAVALAGGPAPAAAVAGAYTAAYSLPAPAGGWSAAYAGAYYVVAQAASPVADVDGNPLPAGTIGGFQVVLDTSGPLAWARATNIALPTASSTLTVIYTDASGVNPATLDGNDVTIAGPLGSVGTMSFTGYAVSGSATTATYRLDPPAGGWTSAMNGQYSIGLRGGQVADVYGNVNGTQSSLGYFYLNVDTTPPTAALSPVADVTTPASSATFTVTYADNVAVNAATIDGNDVRVVYPNGSSAAASLVSVSSSANGTPRTATYSVAAPNGAWQSSNNGAYAVVLQAGQVGDTSGNVAPPATLGTFRVNLETTPPTVSVPAASPDPRNTPIETALIPFSEAVKGFDLSDVSFTRDGSANLLGAGQSLSSFDGGRTWWLSGLTSISNTTGRYTLSVNAAGSGVADLAGNLLATGAATSFTVDVTPPTAALAAPINPITAGPGQAITVTYADNLGVNAATLDAADLLVTGPSGAPLAVSLQSVTPAGNGSPLTATYFVGAPTGSAWTAADNGTYTITAQPGQVLDVVGNGQAGQILGTFQVNVYAGPTVQITPVSPAVRNAPVDTLVMTFSGTVTGFDLGDVSLTRDGAPVPLDPTQQALATDNSQVWYLFGLTNVTAASGQYTFTINAAGSGIADYATGLAMVAGATTTFTVDVVAPTAQVAAVAPSPRAAPVPSVTVAFSEPVGGFDLADLTLTRDGGTTNLLDGTQTLATTDNGTTWTLGNLSAATNATGQYTLSVNAAGSGIADAAGNALAAGASSTFAVDLSGPAIVGASGATVTTGDGTPATFTVTYNDPNGVNVASLGTGDILVSGPNGYSTIATFLGVDDPTNGVQRTATYSAPAPAGGWTSLWNGAYAIRMRDSQVYDLFGNATPVQFAGTFAVNVANAPTDTNPPTASIAVVSPNPRTTSVPSMTITFSEPVTGFDRADLVLTRSGSSANLLTASQVLTTADNQTFTLSGLSGLTTTAGTYTLTLKGANTGIIDGANNALAAGTSTSFTVTVPLPAAPTTPTPANGAALLAQPTVFSWAAATGATSYDVKVDGAYVATNLTTNKWTANRTFTGNVKHTWQVIAKNAAGSTAGAAWTFTVYTSLPSAPSLPKPASSTTTLAARPAILDWADSANATFYYVYLDNVLKGTVTSSQYSVPTTLLKGTHTWRIAAANPKGSTLGATWTFKF